MDFLDRLNHSLMENRLVVDARVRNYLRLIEENAQIDPDIINQNVDPILQGGAPTDRGIQRNWARLLTPANPDDPTSSALIQFIKSVDTPNEFVKLVRVLRELIKYRKAMDSVFPPPSAKIRDSSYRVLKSVLKPFLAYSVTDLTKSEEARELQGFYADLLTDGIIARELGNDIKANANQLERKTGAPVQFSNEWTDEETEETDVQDEIVNAPGPGPETPPAGFESPTGTEPPAAARRMAEIEKIAQQIPDEDGPPELQTRVERPPKKEFSPEQQELMTNIRQSAAAKTGATLPDEPSPATLEPESASEASTPGQKNVEILAQVDGKALVRIRGKSAVNNTGPKIQELANQYNITYRYAVISADELGGSITPDGIWELFKKPSKQVKQLDRLIEQAKSYGDGHKVSQLTDYRKKLVTQFNSRFRTDVGQAYRELEQSQVGESSFEDYFRQRYVGDGLQDGLLKAYLRWDPMDSYRLSGVISSLPDSVIMDLLNDVRERIKPDAEKVTRILARARREQEDSNWDMGAAGGRMSLAARPRRKYATEGLILPLHPLTEGLVQVFLEALDEQPDNELINLATTALAFNTVAKLIINKPEILAQPKYRKAGAKIPADLAKFAASAGQRRQRWLQRATNVPQKTLEPTQSVTEPELYQDGNPAEQAYLQDIVRVLSSLIKDRAALPAFTNFVQNAYNPVEDEHFYGLKLADAMRSGNLDEFFEFIRNDDPRILQRLRDVVHEFMRLRRSQK